MSVVFCSPFHVSGERYTFTDGYDVPKEAIDSIRDATEEELRSIYPENVVEKIIRVNTSRQEELESRRYMSSLPERTNCYGRFEFFKKGTDKRHDQMLASILHNHFVNDSSTD